MDSPIGFLKFITPAVPTLASTALWHSLGRTEQSSKWDLKMALGVEFLRHLMSGGGRKPSPISRSQKFTTKDAGIKGKIWVAKATMAAPKPDNEGLREAVFKAIDEMKLGDISYTKPGLEDIEVEWTGYRSEARDDEPLPDVSEDDKFSRLMQDKSRTSDTTILYFHGGAYYLCDPASHRAVTSWLAKESHGRVCSVRYRLAPQAAFPCQLLDGLLTYLSLLYPPPGSMHEAVPAKNIVFGGDSAGGNLSFALLQLILQLHRSSDDPTINFYGKQVAVPIPAGVTGSSPWLDICRSMPSIEKNAKFDYLPPPDHDDAISRFPSEDIWPTSPPRGDLFCDLTLLDHPLVSPLSASDWTGSPPLWMCTGEEMLTDEDKGVASLAASQKVAIQYEEYKAMPHCFAMMAPALPTAKRLMQSWGEFSRRCVEQPQDAKTSGTYIYAKTGKEEPRAVESVSKVSLEQARDLMRKAKEQRLMG